MSHEMEGWRRYVVVTGGVVICGGIFVLASRSMVAPRGSIGPTILQAQSVFGAMAAVIICLAAATAVAAVVGRLVNAVVGLFVLGAGLWAIRLRTGTIQDLAFADGSLGLVAVEIVGWSLLVLGATFAVFKVAGPLGDIAEADEPTQWGETWGLRGLAAGILMIPVVWLFARSPLKLQTMMAVVVGGLAVGLVGRLLSPHAQPKLLFASACLFGAIGHLFGMAAVNGPLSEAFVTLAVPTLNLPMPLDYAAGSLIGVAMGLGWAKGFLHQEETSAEPQHSR